MTKKIDILGVEYTIKLMTEEQKEKYYEKYWPEDKEKDAIDSFGFTDYKNKIISLSYYKEQSHIYELGKTLYHEIGHVLDYEIITSIVEGEREAVIGEYFYVYRNRLDKLIKEFEKRA